ncbi:hypothetical protein LTR35_017640 [Friedmanniomyces endolithicus]|nr:hypothetical protein LTR35_017640 [Friedmanniomyces endolithicus]KAK0971970.1 hypothetical protein LTR54_017674 [Friedmanniomyces endolithicus]
MRITLSRTFTTSCEPATRVTLERFRDNVLKQATDYFLLSGPDTPLNLFSPTFVSAVTPDEVEHIAGEAPKVKRRRAQLGREITSMGWETRQMTPQRYV